MIAVQLFRDRYDREARLMPALLVAFPPALCAFAWSPDLRSLGPGLLSVLGSMGMTVLLAQFGRDRGSRIQPILYAEWGGQPSVAALRHRDPTLPEELKARYRAFLIGAVPNLCMPDVDQEIGDPSAADRAYEAACAWLLARTRDRKRFALLFEENINYGFRRNLLALKPIALWIAGLTLVACLTLMGWTRVVDHVPVPTAAFCATVIVAAYLAAMLVHVRPNWVQIPATAYARQLLAACDALAEPQPDRRGLGQPAAPHGRLMEGP